MTYRKTTYTVVVLSEDVDFPNPWSATLADIDWATGEGPAVLARMDVTDSVECSAEVMGELLIAAGSDPSFFSIGREG